MKHPLALILSALLGLATATTCSAQGKVLGISERVFNVLEEAQQRLDVDDFAGAREVLGASLEGRSVSDYERAQILNMLGFAWYESDELDEARKRYREALAIEDLPESMQITLNLTLGQIYLMDELYREAQDRFRQLLTFEGQNTPGNRVLLASALIGQEQWGEAEPLLQSAVEELEDRGETPRENWLALLSSVHYALDDFPAMRSVIEKLVHLYPREQYLMNLAALHGQLGDEEKQLALLESLLDDGRLRRSTNLKLIANLYLGAGLPHKAATLLETEIEGGTLERSEANLELLSQAWYMSAELDRAVAPLAEAAALAEDGELYLRLARLHIDAARWSEAEAAAGAALDKGGLRQEGQAWLLRGMAEVNLRRFSDARQRFKRATDFESSADYASQWLAYLAAEEARVGADNS